MERVKERTQNMKGIGLYLAIKLFDLKCESNIRRINHWMCLQTPYSGKQRLQGPFGYLSCRISNESCKPDTGQKPNIWHLKDGNALAIRIVLYFFSWHYFLHLDIDTGYQRPDIQLNLVSGPPLIACTELIVHVNVPKLDCSHGNKIGKFLGNFQKCRFGS